jgi:hypothetical protein
MEVNIRAFKATEDAESCENYILGHKRVLDIYGVPKVTSANHDWRFNPDTYVIIVESLDRTKVFGGGRIQVKTEQLKMPMETIIGKSNTYVIEFLYDIDNGNVAEFCGLWNSLEVAGYGISSITLARVGVAITTQIKIKNLMAFCSPATLRTCIKIGFEKIIEIGNNGTFCYPKEDLLATALVIKDIQGLPTASAKEREAIMNLRGAPVQFKTEEGPKGMIGIFYNIAISN